MKLFRQIVIILVIVLPLFSAVAYGDTWTHRKRLTWNAGYSQFPAMAVAGSNIYVAWLNDTAPWTDEIYFKKSVDGGATWTKSMNLSNTGTSFFPAVAVDGSNIYVVWDDDTPGNPEIYFEKSDDGGATWTTKRLTYTGAYTEYPAIAVDGSNIYVVWDEGDTPEDYEGWYEIYFKKGILF